MPINRKKLWMLLWGWSIPMFTPPPSIASNYDDYKMARVVVKTEAELALLESSVETIMNCAIGVGPLDVIVSPSQLATLRNAGLQLEIRVDDISPAIDRERVAQRGDDFHTAYHRLVEIHDRVVQYTNTYPHLAQLQDFGQSLENRDLLGLRVTGPGGPTKKPAFYIQGGQHAREWISPATVLYIIEQLLTNYGTDPVITRLLDDWEWYILPVLNPDGYEFTWTTNRFWRKNRRHNGGSEFGVDLNRNWSYGWGGPGGDPDPSSLNYRGVAPFSEPETASIRNFVRDHPNIMAFIDFHSYSELLLFPWGNTSAANPDFTEFETITSNMSDRIAAVDGHFYLAGPTYATLYPAAGNATDWAYGNHLNDRFVFSLVIELRDRGNFGFVLPPEQILPTARESFQGLLAMAYAVAAPLNVELLSTLPTTLVPGQTLEISVRVVPRLEAILPDGVKFHYRNEEGPFVEMNMIPHADNRFTASVPVQDCSGSGTLEFYIEAVGELGGKATYPVFAPAELDSFLVVSNDAVYRDDMETDMGWTVGAPDDSATVDGLWVRVDPVGSNAQPRDDNTPSPGTQCWITGQGAVGEPIDQHDVDGGATTLYSPLFSLPDDTSTISYARWYSNNRGPNPNEDQFEISISNDGGTSWTRVEIVAVSTNAWVVHEFRFVDLELAPSSNMLMRFVASDFGADSVVEVGIDDFRIFRTGCVLPDGDANLDASVGSADFKTLSSCFGGPNGSVVSPPCAPFNFDLDQNIDLADFAMFMNLFGS